MRAKGLHIFLQWWDCCIINICIKDYCWILSWLLLLFFTAQELTHQKEKDLLVENSLQTTQDQLRDRIAETVRHEQANRKLQSELKALKEQAINNKKEREDYRWNQKLMRSWFLVKDQMNLWCNLHRCSNYQY